MKSLKLFIIVLVILGLIGVFSPVNKISAGEQRYEYYDEVPDVEAPWAPGWLVGLAQTFVPSQTHSITKVKMPLSKDREGDEGILTISIRNVDNNGYPGPNDLCSQDININSIPFVGQKNADWFEVAFDSSCKVSAGRSYALVGWADWANWDGAAWWVGKQDGAYSKGEIYGYEDGGDSWVIEPGADLLFQEWGYPINRGIAMSPAAFMPPTPPSPTKDNPQGGFKVSINNEAKTTNSRKVILNLSGGPDARMMAISEDPQFTLVAQQPYQSSQEYILSPGNGEKTIYVKFYTQYGQTSEVVSDTIILNEGGKAELSSQSHLISLNVAEIKAKIAELTNQIKELQIQLIELLKQQITETQQKISKLQS